MMALAKTTTPNKVLLGYGVVTVGGQPVGLTRGGSKFVVEREIRQIEADGDKGPVKGRLVIDTETPKLTINALEIFSKEEINSYYPGVTVTDGKVTSTLAIVAGDHKDVVFTGKTLDGESVVVTVKNAVNLGNLEWTLEDKNEVVAAIEFTGTYDEADRETPPWEIQFPSGV